MGLSRLTALEIYTNPKDLEFKIGQERPGALFAIAINRGPGHSFKPMLSSRPFFETAEAAAVAIGETLVAIHQRVTKDLEDQGSEISQNLNPDHVKIDPAEVLNLELIARILEELRQHQVASTYKM